MKIIKKAMKYLVVSTFGANLNSQKIIQTLVDFNPSLIAFWGKDCVQLEEICDECCVGDGSQPFKKITTSSHPDEELEDVVNLVEIFDLDKVGREYERVNI